MKARLLFLVAMCLFILTAKAQTDTVKNHALLYQTDFNDVKGRMLHHVPKLDTAINKFRKIFIPSLTYSPSTGFELGAAISALKFLGKPDSTSISTGSLGVSASTKGLVFIIYKHNIYFPNNKWSLQGDWQAGRVLALDYGIGTGRKTQDEDFSFNGYPIVADSSIFTIKYNLIRFKETAYKKLFGNFYTGIGISINAYTNIDRERSGNPRSHNYRYSDRRGFSPSHYLANAISFKLQYDTRDHPNRPYKGLYADAGVKTFQKAIGSSENALQVVTELRKYWSLSNKNPEHVLAFWHWGSYLINGKIPYLELPGTGKDGDGRSGRAYTIGRFKGLSFFYAEAEYRFPILANKFISGVAFANTETGSNQSVVNKTKLFKYWEPGAGVGIRILYNKYSRSNICIDYGIGNYGAKGIFVSLNEAF